MFTTFEKLVNFILHNQRLKRWSIYSFISCHLQKLNEKKSVELLMDQQCLPASAAA